MPLHSPRLESAWRWASEEEQEAALLMAKNLMANLVHYQGSKRFYDDDQKRIAAEFIWMKRANEAERRDHLHQCRK